MDAAGDAHFRLVQRVTAILSRVQLGVEVLADDVRALEATPAASADLERLVAGVDGVVAALGELRQELLPARTLHTLEVRS